MRRTLRNVLLATTVLGLILAAGGMGRADEKKAFKYSDNGYAILDPSHMSIYRLNDERIMVALQECLTVLDANSGKAKPGAAERWEWISGAALWPTDCAGCARAGRSNTCSLRNAEASCTSRRTLVPRRPGSTC